MVSSLFPEIDAEVFLLEAIFTYSLVLKDKTKTENRNQKTNLIKSNKIQKYDNSTAFCMFFKTAVLIISKAENL